MEGTPAQPPVQEVSAPRFELERVRTVNGRVRITGRWYGVRGRRFIRPSLTAIGGRSRSRVLAELEHKPWSPDASGRWLAEFVWTAPLDDVEAFELAVAPDLAVRVPLTVRTARGRRSAQRGSRPRGSDGVSPISPEGPYFEDLEIGQRRPAPALTLTSGVVAVHQAIVGDRGAATLDRELAHAVFGGVPTPSGLVANVAIGQSSVFTRRVRANLFYRGLQLYRLPALGETLHTETEVVALRQNRPRARRAPTGLAVLRVRTVDGASRPVLGFERCAMLPLRDSRRHTGHQDDPGSTYGDIDLAAAQELAGSWNLAPLRAVVQGPHADELQPGNRWEVLDGDPVTAAPELARLTLNLAAVHYDARATPTGRRLVFGGHAIGLAATQATRAIPGLAAIVAWPECRHIGPVWEEDLLTSTVTVEKVTPLALTGALVHLRSQVYAQRPDGAADVLDWRFIAVVA